MTYGQAKDELYPDAVQLVREARVGSTSLLQTRLRISYTRAVALIDRMEAEGIVGPADGLKPRKVVKPRSKKS